MNSLPLHPAVVHVPLGLAMVMPLIAAGFAWAIWTGRVRPRAWLAVVALQALLVGSGFVSMRLGEAEEDRVETVVEKAMIHEHEEYAEQFVYAAAATLLLGVLAVALRKPSLTRPLVALALVATIAVAALAVRTGQAGGELVYVHGAASAYTSPQK
jgi:uncharacterized membrane protein